MPRIFFSHASEDKGVVLQVYGRLLEVYPELDAWVDTFEIRAGQDLLDRIADGMDKAERFFVFISPVSVAKPWVRAELKRALMQEISGVKPEYVVPVKLGGLEAVPAFMESKKYIDLDRLTQVEWLQEFYSAAVHGQVSNTPESQPNVNWDVVPDPNRPHVVQFAFFARFWAAEVAFAVETGVPAVEVSGVWADGGPHGSESYAKLQTDCRVGWSSQHRLVPGRGDFRMTITFPAGIDAKSVVGTPQGWDGEESSESGILFLNNG